MSGARDITAESVDLLRVLAAAPATTVQVDALSLAGRGETPPHVQALMQRGYAVRVGVDCAAITPTGRAFVAGLDWAARR